MADAGWSRHLEPSQLETVSKLLEPVIEALIAAGASERERFGIRLSLDEALTNAIKHGNGLDPQKSVRFEWRIAGGCFEAKVGDDGPGFEPAALPDPTQEENLTKASGRGVMLMQHYMDQVTFADSGREIHLIRRFAGRE